MYKFSVIVIIKNTKHYLSKCLDSIVNQSYKNFEIVIVDDHSSEKSDDVIKQYIHYAYPMQYLYLDKDCGPGGARNQGMSLSSGEYILFIDSDDWIDLDCLQKSAIALDNNDADIGMFSLIRNYDMPTTEPYYKCKYDDTIVINGTTAFKIMSEQYDFGIIISPSPVNKIYRRKYLEENHIFFLEKVYYEDVLFAFQTLLANGKVVTIPNVKYHHYKRMGSIVQSLSQKHFDDLEIVFINAKNFLVNNELYNEYVYNYYKIFERFYNLLIRQVFEFSQTEEEKKQWLRYSFHILKNIIVIDEYLQYYNAEDIRRHLQPYILNTSLR